MVSSLCVRIFALCFCIIISLVAKSQERSTSLKQNKKSTPQLQQLKTKTEWAKKRLQILNNMQEVMGALPSRPGNPPEAHFIDTSEAPSYSRYSIHLLVHQQEKVPALLYVPKNSTQSEKRAAVMVLHATGALGKHLVDSLSKGPYDPIATELANQGYIVLAPDYPSFGDLAQHDFNKDRYESGTMQGIFNHMRCVDYLQSRQDVDKNKIGAIGHSLGGHNAIFLGAFDERIQIVVSSCGWTLFDYYDAGKSATERFGGKLGPWAQDRYMPFVKTKFKMDAALMPFDFDEAIAAIAPRHFFSNSPVNDGNFNVEGVKHGIENANYIYKLLGVPENIQVHYPEAGHEFPYEIRLKAYAAIAAALR